MAHVLLATDADWIFDEVFAALDGEHLVHRVRQGAHVEAAVLELAPDLVLLDLQIGNMGGVAACLNLRLEGREQRLPTTKVLILLDREADIFLARRAEADGWLVKPLDAFRLRRAVAQTLATGSYVEGIPDEWKDTAPLLNH